MSERVVQLPSGLTVAVEPMVSTRTASIGVWVGVGARDEPAEHAGVSHFLEHLLFKGTTSRSAIEISQTVDRVGGDINAYTSKEYTTYYCRLPARFAATGIELLGEVLTSPALRDDDVESERQVILEELAMDDDSPEDVVHREFARRVFGDHPLGRDTAGDRGTVRSLAADDVRAFFTDRYRTENTVVAVAGAVDPDEVIEQVAVAFANMGRGDGRVARSHPDDRPPAAEVGGNIDDDTEQVHLVLGGRALARDDDDREALDVVNHVLGGGLSSRLFDEIRERRGLAYTVFSTAAAYADAGAWSVYAGTLPEHAHEVLDLIEHELDRLVAEGVTPEELEIAQGYLAGSYEMGLEDSGARMSRLGGQLTLLGHLRSVEEQIDRWSAVSLEDVDRVIRRVYGNGRPLTVTLGPS
jgi:predicted Zn-dependent peptidase